MLSRGVKEVLKKRLKNYYKRKKLAKERGKPFKKNNFDFFAVIDFEATCEENNIDFPHEIIEFPIVLIDVQKMEIVSVVVAIFHIFSLKTNEPRHEISNNFTL